MNGISPDVTVALEHHAVALAHPFPVVQMCADPACKGLWSCPSAPDASFWRFALGDWVGAEASAEDVVTYFRSQLVLGCASDSVGVKHLVPAALYTVHKGSVGRPVPLEVRRGEVYCVAVCEVATASREARDAVLAPLPVWSHDLAVARIAALRAA